jgi:hypothetical protein
MKKVLFTLAICGLAFTSCTHSTKEAKSQTEEHQHDACDHDHGDGVHSHGSAHQEEFVVDSTSKEELEAEQVVHQD